MREVVKAVKDVSGVDFTAEEVARRPGDPACIVASNYRIRTVLDWQPVLDKLSTIVEHALAWERVLMKLQ